MYRAETPRVAAKFRAKLASASLPDRHHVIKGTDLETVDSHPMLDLIRRGAPSYGITGRQVVELTQVYLDLAGECFWYLPRSVLGSPAEIMAFPPHWITEVPSPNDAEGYYKVDSPYLKARIAATEIAWLKQPSAVDPIGRGSGIGMTISEDLDIDEYAARTLASRFENNATPEFIVAIEGLTAQQAPDVEARFLQKHRGFNRSGLPHFTSGKTKVTQLSPKIVDLNVDVLRNSSAKNIREAWGVPPEALGIIDNSNRATIDAASYLFALLVTDPRLKFLEEAINTHVLWRFAGSESLVASYESPIPEDWQFASNVMGAHPEAFSVNEIRALVGLEPVEGGEGVGSATEVDESYVEDES